jgi:hypothetical protein
MRRHVGQGLGKPGAVAHVADRSKEAGDDVKALHQLETVHARLMEGDVGEFAARDAQQSTAQGQPGHLEAFAQMADVRARSTPDVQQRPAGIRRSVAGCAEPRPHGL